MTAPSENTASPAEVAEIPGQLASRIAIVAVGSAMFMQFLDSTALSTALPTLARDLHANPVDLRLVLTIYIVVQALFLPASGWVADRFGARRVFMAAMLVFLLGSILSGLSHSLPQLVGARVVQGLGGAMMAPVGRIIVVGSSPRDQLIQAMMWLSLPAFAGPVLGPPLAGLILSVGTWPWIFFINLPIGIAALMAIFRVVPKVDRPHPGRFDALGFLYSVLFIGAVMTLVEAAGHDPRIEIASAFVAAPAAGAFLLHARRRTRAGGVPVLDLSLLRYRTFRSTITGGSLARLGIGGTPYLLALLLQIGLGWSPLRTGIVTVAAAIGALCSRPFGPRLVRMVGFRRMLLISTVVIAVLGVAPAFFNNSMPVWMIVAILILTGYARASQFTSANALSYADVPQERISAASTLLAVMQQISMSLGITLAGSMLELSHHFHAGPMNLRDFAVSFGAITFLGLMSFPVYASLPPNAGANISGQKLRA